MKKIYMTPIVKVAQMSSKDSILQMSLRTGKAFHDDDITLTSDDDGDALANGRSGNGGWDEGGLW